MSGHPKANNPANLIPAPSYHPGAYRTRTDREAIAVAAFLRDHPEYAEQPHEMVAQVASTYLDEFDHELRNALADEGVPTDVVDMFEFDNEEAEENGSDYAS